MKNIRFIVFSTLFFVVIFSVVISASESNIPLYNEVNQGNNNGHAVIPFDKVYEANYVGVYMVGYCYYLDSLELSNDGFYYKYILNSDISRDDIDEFVYHYAQEKKVAVYGEVLFKKGETENFGYIIKIKGKKIVIPTYFLKLINPPNAVIEIKNTELENNNKFMNITSGLTDGERRILINYIQSHVPGDVVDQISQEYFSALIHHMNTFKYFANSEFESAKIELLALQNDLQQLTDERIDKLIYRSQSAKTIVPSASSETKEAVRHVRDSYLQDTKAKLIVINTLQKQIATKELYAQAVEQEKTDKESAIKSYKELIEKYDSSEKAAKAKTRIEELTKDVSDETVKGFLAEGDRLFDLKDYGNASKSYKKALEINPTDTAIADKVKKADDLYNSGLAEKAQVDKERKQNQIKMHVDLAKDAYNKHLFDKALEEVQKALVLDSTNPDAKLVKLDIETSIQAQKQKEKEVEALAHYQTGVGYLSRGRYSMAMDEFLTALNLDPSLNDAKSRIDQMRKTLTVEQIDSIGLAEVIYKPERISLYNATKYPVQYKGKIVKWNGVVKQKLNNKYIIKTNEDLMFSMTIINRNQSTINYIDGSPITMIGRVDQLLTFENVLGVPKDILNIEALYIK